MGDGRLRVEHSNLKHEGLEQFFFTKNHHLNFSDAVRHSKQFID